MAIYDLAYPRHITQGFQTRGPPDFIKHPGSSLKFLKLQITKFKYCLPPTEARRYIFSHYVACELFFHQNAVALPNI